MENITSSAALKNAILFLEVEQEVQSQLFRDRFFIAYESLKPANLIKSAFHEATSSPGLVNNVLGVVVGLASGYMSRTITVGRSANVVRKFLGTLLQFGVTNVVAKHPDSIQSIGQFIFQHILRKKSSKLNRP